MTFRHGNETAFPASFADDDVRFSEQLVSFFVERLTDPGDAVLDPFAGKGGVRRRARPRSRCLHPVAHASA
jgi:hypothetical protein